MICNIANVSKKINDNKILDNINLTINEKDIIGIVGHNGSGKTMLLRAICGLILVDEGKIEYADNTSFGVIIEDPGFMNEYSAYENLEYLASINNKIDKKKIYDTLESVGLKGRENKKVKTFSLGMKKKLGIAQAIMENQNLLLLDEPLNALDDESSKDIQNLLKKYCDDNKAIVIVSHHFDEITNLCTKIYKMSDGKLKQISLLYVFNSSGAKA